MIRTAIIPCAIVIAVTCFACAPPAPPVVTTASACNPNDPSSFGDFVQLLSAKPPFDPSLLTPPPASSVSPLPPLPDPRRRDLIAAFTAAPMEFRTALCGVNGIYIDENASESWGFRTKVPPPPTPLQRYIGLAGSLWSPGHSATIFSDYETQRLRTAAKSAQVSLVSGPDTNTSKETVLAALVHEYGHLLWYDTFKPKGAYTSGGQFGPSDPTKCGSFVHGISP
jgi:hypothetical protein